MRIYAAVNKTKQVTNSYNYGLNRNIAHANHNLKRRYTNSTIVQIFLMNKCFMKEDEKIWFII